MRNVNISPPEAYEWPPNATDFHYSNDDDNDDDDDEKPSLHTRALGMRRGWASTTIYISNSIPITTPRGPTFPRRRHRDCTVPSYRSLAPRTSSSCFGRGKSLPPVSGAVRSCRVSSCNPTKGRSSARRTSVKCIVVVLFSSFFCRFRVLFPLALCTPHRASARIFPIPHRGDARFGTDPGEGIRGRVEADCRR